MTVRIHIDNENGFSPEDKAVIAALHTALSGETFAAPAAAAPKAAPAAKKAAAPAPAAEVASEPEVEEDLVGGDGPTMEDATSLATKMVSEGKAPKVKETLTKYGAKRVSEVPLDQIAAFIADLG